MRPSRARAAAACWAVGIAWLAAGAPAAAVGDWATACAGPFGSATFEPPLTPASGSGFLHLDVSIGCTFMLPGCAPACVVSFEASVPYQGDCVHATLDFGSHLVELEGGVVLHGLVGPMVASGGPDVLFLFNGGVLVPDAPCAQHDALLVVGGLANMPP